MYLSLSLHIWRNEATFSDRRHLISFNKNCPNPEKVFSSKQLKVCIEFEYDVPTSSFFPEFKEKKPI